MVYTAIKTPGVYVNEVSIFPPSVAQVPTAIPAFVGYTEKAEETNGESLFMKTKKISSMVEFVLYFGNGPKLIFDKATGNGVELDANNQVVKAINKQKYFLYDSMQMFFGNGGGDCYVIAVEKYKTDGSVALGSITPASGMQGGVEVLKEVDEPTMIVFPDAVSMTGTDIYSLQQQALQQCADLMDRVGVFDIKQADDKTALLAMVKEFRDNIGMSNLKYGAVYAPWLKVGIKKDVHYRDIKGQIVKAGTTVTIDLKTLVKNFSATDEAAIKGLITALDEVVTDNNFIDTSFNTYLAAAGNSAYRPTGFSGLVPLPSVNAAFDLLSQSVNNKIAEAEIEPAATQAAKVTAAALELKKMIHQILHTVVFIDDFGFKDAAFMQNSEMVANTFSQINYSANKTPVAPLTFDDKVTELLNWDAILVSTAGTVINPIASAGGALAAIRPAAPFLALAFDAINMAAGGTVNATTALMLPNPLAATEPLRIANLKVAAGKLKDLFTFFSNILLSIDLFGDALEKSKEDALLRMWPVYKNIVDKINSDLTIIPPSGAMAGIYARVDNERGVWKAPANVSVTYAKGTLVNITDNIQDGLNVDVDAGKSVNAIRVFSGKGTMVWGARTLAGNDNEWRYVPVRRFFNMVEESVKKSTSWAVFEPNDANTWVKVKSMIENFLTLLWRQGALAGSKPDEAFFVEVGLNKTMTFVDILEGRMIVMIGMAVVRPAEFIILEFSHKVQTS